MFYSILVHCIRNDLLVLKATRPANWQHLWGLLAYCVRRFS